MPVATWARAAPAARFNASTISGLKLWFDASNPGSAFADGDRVGTWNDVSASAAHATQGTAGNKPYYYAHRRLYIPSVGGWAGVADSAANSIGGNLTAIAYGVLPDTNWNADPAADYTIFGKWGSAAGQRSWKMKLTSTSRLIEMAWSTDGTNAFQAISRDYSTVVATGVRSDFAIEVEPNNAGAWAVRIYHRTTGSGNAWALFGLGAATGTGASAAIFDGTSRVLVGSLDTTNETNGNPFVGSLDGVALYSGLQVSGVSTTPVIDADFAIANPASTDTTTTFIDKQTVTWTVTEHAAIPMILAGRPSMHFTGGAMRMVSGTIASQVQPLNLFLVGRCTRDGAAGNTNPDFCDGLVGAGGRLLLQRTFSTTNWTINAGSSVAGGTGNASPHLFYFLASGASSALRIDRAASFTGSANTNAITGLIIGALQAGTSGLRGDIAEIMVYQGTLTTAQRDIIEGYLADKYHL